MLFAADLVADLEEPTIASLPSEDGQHIVTLLRQGVSTDELFDAVAICSGLNVEPARPLVPGLYHAPTVLCTNVSNSN